MAPIIIPSREIDSFLPNSNNDGFVTFLEVIATSMLIFGAILLILGLSL